MTIEERYLELRKKSVNRKNNRYLFNLTWKPTKISPISRCLKEDISHKMCWIFHETLPINGFRYAIHLKKLCMPHEKSCKYAWEPRDGDCGRLRNLSAIFLENNSSMTSQLSLNLGIFRTVEMRYSGGVFESVQSTHGTKQNTILEGSKYFSLEYFASFIEFLFTFWLSVKNFK